MKKQYSLYICISIFALVCAVSFSYVFAQTASSPTPSPTPTSSPAPKPPANTYWFQNGVYPSTAYAGTADTYISKSAPTINYGSAATVVISGPSTAPKRGLLRFDISLIPSSCKVKSASLVLNIIDSAQNGYWIYEMKRNWSETQATWNQYATGLNWQTAGAGGANDRGTVGFGTLFGSGVKTTVINASYIQQAITAKAPVNFFILFDQYTDSLGFSSKNAITATQRPKLEIVCEGSYEVSYMKGDANRDGKVDISDIITIAGLLQQVRPTVKAPDVATVAMVAPCTAAADYDNNGVVNISDATALIGFLFGTPTPNPVQPLVTTVVAPTVCTKYP